MSVLNENQLLGASGAGGEFEIEQSLRFNDDDGSYLSRTPSSAGNLKTWTFSAWVKRGNMGLERPIISVGLVAGDPAFSLYFHTSDQLRCWTNGANTSFYTNAVYRDPSAWYHIVLKSSTNSPFYNLYVNGEEVTSFATDNRSNYPGTADREINSTALHTIGKWYNGGVQTLDCYIGEVNFIDGQALTPDSLGETGKYGEWNPIEYAGTYGTNGFYLPFKQDYSVEGFSTVVYEGTGASNYIGGTGFSPDMSWFKVRSEAGNHQLYDTVRGASARLVTNATTVEATTNNGFAGWQTDGFSLDSGGGGGDVNTNGRAYVAWNWDMGSTTASNTDGTITTSVRANTTYGQSIVSWTGNATNNTKLGHGLGSTPEIVIVKSRTTAAPWKVGGSVIQAVYGDGSNNSAFLSLNTSAAADQETTGFQGNTATTIGVGANSDTNSNGATYIAYAFHSVTGYSKFSSYSGNGNATGPIVTLGFPPAFVIIRRSNGVENWRMYDNTRNPNNPVNSVLQPNEADAEATSGNNTVNFSANGFQLTSTSGGTNASGGTYIYMAFADTREYAYWLDQSGNNNDWTSEGGLTESDVMVDSPTNNFAIWNPLNLPAAAVLSEGNTKLTQTSNDRGGAGNMAISSGKFYFEIYYTAGSNPEIGLAPISQSYANSGATNSTDKFLFISNNGGVRTPAWTATSATGLSSQTGISVIGFAIDADAGKAWFTNASGTYFNSGNPATGSNPQATFDSDWLTQTGGGIVPFAGIYTGTGSDIRINFGSDSSFAGAKTPQGKQDSGGIGDFFYQPPSGFLALCTSNLPSVDVIPSEHFNTVLYTGTRQNKVISGVGFQPDFIWLKTRSTTSNHVSVDSVRGGGKAIQPNTVSTENQYGAQDDKVTAFSSDGFSLGVDAAGYGFNDNNATYAAWNWKAGGSASSNTNGTITSSVSANPSAGFSIVSYTGTGANATVGHGLASAPEMLIVKNRNVTDVWLVYHDGLASDPQTDFIILDRSDAKGDTNTAWNDTAPTSTVFNLGSLADVNRSSSNLIAYCFHSVDGYSKVGSFVGTGGSGVVDGAFINLGFRPAMVLVKSIAAADWNIFDNRRSGYNSSSYILLPNSSAAEDASNPVFLDLLSNGFKWRFANADFNASGVTYIFYAIAEMPFKHSNAR